MFCNSHSAQKISLFLCNLILVFFAFIGYNIVTIKKGSKDHDKLQSRGKDL